MQLDEMTDTYKVTWTLLRRITDGIASIIPRAGGNFIPTKLP